MTWDVILQPAKKQRDLGPRGKVLQLLKEIVPDIDLSNPTHGFIDQADLAIEFSIGDRDPVDSILLHIHAAGSFEKIEDTLRKLCKNTAWRAKNLATGSLIH